MSDREYPGRPILAVGTIVVRNGCVLVARRGRAPSRGKWSVPGGAVDVGESLEDAARREIREECGIEVELTDTLEVIQRITRDDAQRIRFHYVIVDFVARWLSGEPMPSEEASEVRWVRPEDLDGLDMTAGTADVIRRLLRKSGLAAR
ncbi:MAG TPA: NUDIX hydrolase [Candidatus Sulfotelmatobacter sp.]|nr:NUDIX hydrolase [Candidatus Sulfotelmatobacter sp.]